MWLSRFIRKPIGSGQIIDASEDLSFEAERLPELRGEPIKFGPVRVLSYRPPIFLSGIPYDEFLGMAPAFGRRYGDVKAGFIIFPTWTIETPKKAQAIRQSFLQHTKRYSRHTIRYICNTPGEAQLLEKFGQPAMFLNHKFTVSERVFRPLPEAKVEFDAIYNARFVDGKRHELAAGIERVAYVTYCEPQESRQQEFKRLWRETEARSPAHELLNEIADDLPVRVCHREVNAALARASTGLLLSEEEGASYAAVEYMLAGLSVVSTPSVGGRDAYFDPEYCIVADATPRAIRDAVSELKSRNIPKSYIRDKTLKKLEPERQRFLAMVDSLIEELGGQPQFSGAWPFGEISGVPWGSFKDHLADFDQSAGKMLEKEFGLKEGACADIQLSPIEIRTIINEIQRKPNCSLLVFGCGNDSLLWEKVNAGGTTVFVEDNPEWAAKTLAQLDRSGVHVVNYNSRQADWREWLDCPSRLQMDLPAEIQSRRWDIIIVDGPAGENGERPGRMKSIYAASGLVAGGGLVFVHDCDRPAEDAFASRYLGAHRLAVEVNGRALLRGYAF